MTSFFFKVTILSIFRREGTRKLLVVLGNSKVSNALNVFGTTELIAHSIRSRYLSFVSDKTKAGRTFIFVSSAKGKG